MVVRPPELVEETRPASPGADVVEEVPFRRGDAIDRFTVLEQLGVGGMGVVVSAYDPTLDRKVAIKLLRPDRLTRDRDKGRARLLREAQAMARLSHPNVISVYEVGTLDDQVFVAMELVEGETLSAWLRRGTRHWREVVRVFALAGRGLAASHGAGVVHRDFKPDNVLVSAGGEVRVTDFGLAGVSATAPADAAMLTAPLTRTGAVMGTPAYMSPEQHRGEEADARSDQYSFCVALYEALYGVRPFTGETPGEILDAMDAGRVSPPLRDAPRRLRPLVLRGLAARPEDRWPGMDALLQALERDPTAARRRWLLWSGVAVALAGAGGWIALRDEPALCQGADARAASLWDGAARQRVKTAFLATGSPIAAELFARVDGALAGRAAGWAAARTDACEATHVRGDQSEAMLDLRMQCLERARRQISSLVDLWSRGEVDLVRTTAAAGSVGDVTACADTEALAMPVPLPRDPAAVRRIDEVRARLDAAEAHRRAGRLQSGLELARQAVAAARDIGYAPALAEAQLQNGKLECDVGVLEAGVPLFYAAARTGATAHDDVLVARAYRELLFYVGVRDKRLDEAATIWKFAEVALERAGGRDELLADLLWAQGGVLREQGKQTDALPLLRRALAIFERLRPADHPDIARVLHLLAFNLEDTGKLDEAQATYRRALAIFERALGPEHPTVGSIFNNLANVLVGVGDYAEASRLAERHLAIDEKVYPADHPAIASGLHTLAVVRDHQGRADEARVLYERAAQVRSAALGPEHPLTLDSRKNLADLAAGRGDSAAARKILDELVPIIVKVYGATHENTANAYTSLGFAALGGKDAKTAEDAFASAVAIWRKPGGERGLTSPLYGLGHVRTLQGRYDEAIALHREAKAIREKISGPDHPYLAEAYLGIGKAHLGAGRIRPAVENLERAVTMGEKSLGESYEVAMARFDLARALWASGAHDRALALARSARDFLSGKKIAVDLDAVESWLHIKSRATSRRTP